MTSLIPNKASAPRLLLISAGVLLCANHALAAEPGFDPQDQARQFILAKPDFAVATDLNTKVTAAAAARDKSHVDPQEQARQLILAKPNFEVTANSRTKGVEAVAARRGDRGDSQEQARQLIRQSRISG